MSLEDWSGLGIGDTIEHKRDKIWYRVTGKRRDSRGEMVYQVNGVWHYLRGLDRKYRWVGIMEKAWWEDLKVGDEVVGKVTSATYRVVDVQPGRVRVESPNAVCKIWYSFDEMEAFYRPGPSHIFYLEDGVLQVSPALTKDEDDPLGLSIQKWEWIVEALERGEEIAGDGGVKTCGLCLVHNRRFGRDCAGCPVREKAGESGCRGTPHENWDRWVKAEPRPGYFTDRHRAKKLLEYARKEVEFLRSLREEAEVEVETETQDEDTIHEAYLVLQQAAGFRAGDRVRVLRKAEDFELGWPDSWSVYMDDFIGSVHTIQWVSQYGIGLVQGFGRYNFPWFVLEKVQGV